MRAWWATALERTERKPVSPREPITITAASHRPLEAAQRGGLLPHGDDQRMPAAEQTSRALDRVPSIVGSVIADDHPAGGMCGHGASSPQRGRVSSVVRLLVSPGAGVVRPLAGLKPGRGPKADRAGWAPESVRRAGCATSALNRRARMSRPGSNPCDPRCSTGLDRCSRWRMGTSEPAGRGPGRRRISS